MSGEEPTLSKSARKRANQKARAAEEAEAAAPPPAPAPAPKAKAKAESAPAAKGKAKAEPAPAAPAAKPKAKAKEQPAPAAAEPKAKAKAKAKEAEPAPAPKPEAKAKAKQAASKPAAKPKAQPKAEEKPAAPEDPWIQFDDGKGGGWEEATGMSKKQAKQKEKKEQREEMERQMQKAGVGAKSASGAAQHVPGMPTMQAVQQAAATEKKGKQNSQAAALLAAANAAMASAANVGNATVSAAAVAAAKTEPVKETVVDNSVSAAVKIPDNKIGWVIGPKGATIAMIKEKTGVKTIDTSGGVATIVGDKDPVAMAEAAIHELIQKGFTSLAFDNFQEAGVQVAPTHFPNIIGERGCIINAIKKEAKCEVGIPEVPKNSPPGKKFKITLSGSADSVKLGTEIINAIVKYGHHEVTHPGFVHEEVEVEDWKYKYIIGTKGSEMRHIQNSFHVKVNIPRETSEIQNVVVVGEKQDVERACKHIEKILINADQPKGRGSEEKAVDTWGEEEEMESWMSPYIYKRK